MAFITQKVLWHDGVRVGLGYLVQIKGFNGCIAPTLVPSMVRFGVTLVSSSPQHNVAQTQKNICVRIYSASPPIKNGLNKVIKKNTLTPMVTFMTQP